uniref:Branched-chain amino acid ABC transporter permease n=1 Tax=Desulfobacca acetoxidans TaxID=60893 RepID=A0A7V4G8H5_9BACT
MTSKNLAGLLPYLITAALALAPLAGGDVPLYYQVWAMACLYGALAAAWNIYAYSGAISLGHGAFFGLGAYSSGLLNLSWQWPPSLTIPLGGVLAAAFGGVWALGLLRLRGVYLGLATLAAMEVCRVVVDNWDSFTSGSMGLVGLSRLPAFFPGMDRGFGAELKEQYLVLLAFLVVVTGVHGLILTCRWGWALRAVRENESAAAMIGIPVDRCRSLALVASAALTGWCGALYAHAVGVLEPGLVFSLHLSALPLVLSIFGGWRHPVGPVLGALILYPLDQLVLQPRFPQGHGALYGLMILLAIYFFPGGIAAWLSSSGGGGQGPPAPASSPTPPPPNP